MIIIGFGTNEKLASRLMRWATASEWSHVWIEYPSAVWGGRWVAHAGPDGVVKMPLEAIERAYPRRRLYECKADLTSGLTWARQYIGADYDYRSMIWNGILLVLYRVTAWQWLYKIVSRNAAKYFCSELVAGVLKASGVEGAQGFDPELTTPGDLEGHCAGSDDFWVV